MPHALLLEDDPASLRALGEWVSREGFRVTPVETLEKARAEIASGSFDLAILDVQVPDGSGVELLEDLADHPHTEIVFVTGHASVDSAVEALRGGAVDYLTKPVDLHRLRRILGNVVRTLELRREIDGLRAELRQLGRFGPMIGGSPAMQEVYDLVLRVAPTDATVLISGETGTGKELVAETVHGLSRRASHAFVPVNCGAMPPSLIESELFGHERGSFTGADRRHRGIFEQANGGTLFLDEITEMPVALQVKLLRVLETGHLVRLGGTEHVPIDVRVIAATNRDPQEAVEEGTLRRDLLYRLLVFPIVLPPLRKRDGDVPLLAGAFLDMLNKQNEAGKQFAPEALDALERHAWPGNVRELRHAVERAFIVSGPRIEATSFELPGGAVADPVPATDDGRWLRVAVGSRVKDVERRLVLATLEDAGGDKRQAARKLGISLKTLYNRLHEYGAM